MPQTVSEENLTYYSSENFVLPPDLIRQFLLQSEEEIDEEYTEFIPCFRLKDTRDWFAIIYWKAELLNYSFILAIYDKNGILKNRRILAGTVSDGTSVVKSIATIDEDWIVQAIIGKQSHGQELYDTSSSTVASFELMPDGTIISHDE